MLVNLTLVPTSFTLWIIEGNEQDNNINEQENNIRLSGQLRLGEGETVTLTTEEEFDNLRGTLSLVEQTSEVHQEDGSIGTISYYKAGYTVYLHLSKPRFEVLLAAIARGQMPSEISVDIDGMKYDRENCESSPFGIKWDNKTSPRLPIKSIRFIAPMIGPDPDFSNDRSREDSMPPSRAQFSQLTSAVSEIKTRLDSLHTQLSWLVIIMVILFAALIWRYR